MFKVSLWVLMVLYLPLVSIDMVNSAPLEVRQLVKVGTPERPPLFINDANDDVTAGVLQAMNQVQDQYRFESFDIPVKRRSQAIKNGLADIMMWDNPAWQWRIPLTTSWPLLHAKDIFIALRANAVDQSYFETFSDKTFALVGGYTYSFLMGNKNAQEQLEAVFVKSEEISIRMLLAERVDIAVTSDTTLKWFLKKNPQAAEQILVFNTPDLEYNRTFLVPEKSPISAKAINRILLLADRQGLLKPVYQRFGLEVPIYPPVSVVPRIKE
ncbi:hypothetical protein [Pseudomaricurvus sp.]|uniref:hypothetical protein n=1 Tax=Pseudomaricurvus sp. TaxID=2004510 RepID=UPI003F6AA38A